MAMPTKSDQAGKRMWPFSSDLSYEWAVWWSGVANGALLLSLLIGVVATYLMYHTGNIKEDHWDNDRRGSAERISELNELAEREQLERIKLEAKLSPRRLSGEQSSKMLAILSTKPLPIAIVSRLLDAESGDFSDDFERVFVAAGWSVLKVRNWTASAKGVAIATADGTALPGEVKDLLEAVLDSANIPHTTMTIQTTEFATMSPHVQQNVLYLLIGAKLP